MRSILTLLKTLRRHILPSCLGVRYDLLKPFQGHPNVIQSCLCRPRAKLHQEATVMGAILHGKNRIAVTIRDFDQSQQVRFAL